METREIYTPKQEDIFELATPGKTPEDYKNRDIKSLDLDMKAFISQPEIHRREILDFGDEGFLLSNVLTAEECKEIIQRGEDIGFSEIGVRKDYRNSDRIMVRSEDLSRLLWQRVRGFLDDLVVEGDPHKVHIHGVESMLQGRWRPAYMNPLFRLCRYYPGGHFAPHFDGHFVQSSTERSMKTFMLYLNGGFSGATTNFVDESQQLYKDETGKYCAEEKNILHRVTPETGLAICFNHHRLHEGEALKNGVKYILRTDILYQKVDGSTASAEDDEAMRLVQEADRLESSGDTLQAMELYRKAFKLSPAVAKSFGN